MCYYFGLSADASAVVCDQMTKLFIPLFADCFLGSTRGAKHE